MMDKSHPGDRPFALACLLPPSPLSSSLPASAPLLPSIGGPERPLPPSYGTAHNDIVRGTPALPLARTL